MTDQEKRALEERLEKKTPKGWYGLAVPERWYEIIDRCDRDLEEIVPGYEVHQIKSKFDRLRYYIGYPKGVSKEVYEKAEARIRQAEHEVAVLEGNEEDGDF